MCKPLPTFEIAQVFPSLEKYIADSRERGAQKLAHKNGSALNEMYAQGVTPDAAAEFLRKTSIAALSGLWAARNVAAGGNPVPVNVKIPPLPPDLVAEARNIPLNGRGLFELAHDPDGKFGWTRLVNFDSETTTSSGVPLPKPRPTVEHRALTRSGETPKLKVENVQRPSSGRNETVHDDLAAPVDGGAGRSPATA